MARIQYEAGEGVIQIHIRKQKDRLHIVVEDNGVESAEKTWKQIVNQGRKDL